MTKRLDYKEACELLGCKKSQFYKLVFEEKIPVYGVGKRNRYVYESDCRKVMKEKTFR